ncbi:Membrane proteinase PrsW, cleaves anti-sigma factor RsiW, M82 family [Lutibacter oricola]|uniref:Membrane proteinase PrsW, cleaves anti-sigma factor RsiW, M82 family n=1 Tax=Lutibacter oricola TaxID=762486 RepID=A0A1H2XKE0_9FLAO|nr:PrsW family glutamic-type intramembrane protease [Lutibacter oricola]SDW92769.1 Membrane proteinase PrsW, cleaves anti-sigma factor RsiW, M82 family [Lutibacter oricola]
MIVAYTFIALFIAWIWVDYFRLIDIYEKERLGDFIITFLLGCASVLVVFGIDDYVFDKIGFDLNGNFLNDLLYSIFGVGAVEEFAKLIPFVIVYFVFKNRINEPIDYLAYISISALGFSAVENVLYFNYNGPGLINGRSILATVSHMFDSSLIAYGFIRYKYQNKKGGMLSLFLFFLLAAVSHGFYDFWMLYEKTASFGWIISVIYFFITLSWFAIILNNALNNSTFFTYKRVINSKKVVNRMLLYYGLIFISQFVLIWYTENINIAVSNIFNSILFAGIIIIITVIRLSRFKLIENRWDNLKIELPFSVTIFGGFAVGGFSPMSIKVKGNSFDETHINAFYNEYFIMNPLNSRSSFLKYDRISFIEHKLYLKHDELFYKAKVYSSANELDFKYYFLKPKTNGTILINNEFPIAALLHVEDYHDNLEYKDFNFLEWIVLKPKI